MNYLNLLSIGSFVIGVVSLVIALILFFNWLKRKNVRTGLVGIINELKNRLDLFLGGVPDTKPTTKFFLPSDWKETWEKSKLMYAGLCAIKGGIYKVAFLKFRAYIKYIKTDQEWCTILNLLGAILIELGGENNLRKAGRIFLRMIEIAKRSDIEEALPSAYVNLGKIYRTLGEWDDSLVYRRRALKIYREKGNWEGEILQLGALGILQHGFGNSKKALRNLHEALVLLKGKNNPELLAHILRYIGNVYVARDDYDKALEYLEEALDIYFKNNILNGQAASLTRIGEVNMYKGFPKRAEYYLDEAYKIFLAIRDLEGQALVYNHKGILASRLGDIGKALGFHMQALNIDNQIGNLDEQAVELLNIGVAFGESERNKEALPYFYKSLNIFQKIGHLKGQALCLLDLGLLKNRLRNYRTALKQLQKAHDFFERIPAKAQVATCKLHIGDALLELERYEVALSNYEQALNIFKRRKDEIKTEILKERIAKLKRRIG